ncbi:TraR/DksA family transcriptional regulator [Rhabdothermincola salaria]|uniref:TraR/DksA family transcriptional regulator n=1 Tax=Rhabdothermincola salaria TaxID=2903142 RepID=UPI001E31EB22|nr:TraR/DksA C4-type zinc finger protein [Rhabdothermincola salaria]MCD9623136.1 TraR/DksA C4-type zinc finger protein [Rhabdothermincola salaria]
MTDTGGTMTPDSSGETAAPVPGDVRGVLEETRAQVEVQIQDLGVEGESGIVDENFADSAAVSAEQGEAQALASRLREQLDDVEKALARLDDGTYGACEVCGNPIGEARLEAMPATRFCIEHAG